MKKKKAIFLSINKLSERNHFNLLPEYWLRPYEPKFITEKELEREIKEQVSPHPLRRITIRDISKALIGAFIGIISHFAFSEGAHLAEGVSVGRASFILLVSFLIGFIFIYLTGYRKILDRKLLFFLPVRLVAIYLVTLATVFFVLYTFNFTVGADISVIYKQVAVVSLPAIIGASAADLIGRE